MARERDLHQRDIAHNQDVPHGGCIWRGALTPCREIRQALWLGNRSPLVLSCIHAVMHLCQDNGHSYVLVTGSAMKTLVKMIGKSGQVSFGKEHAGRQVLIEQVAPGEWRVRTATVIPDNERWMHTPEMAQSLERALGWERRNPPRGTSLAELRELEKTNGQRANRTPRKSRS